MGKIIKDGFTFVAYANSRLIRNVEDIPDLKHTLITLSESKTHRDMSRYAVLLGEHIVTAGGIERSAAIDACLSANIRWQNGEIKFRDALDVAGMLNDLAREERDPVTVKALRAMGQIAATPHVRWHPLVASEYAMVMINLLYPHDFDRAREERERQIEMMNSV